MLNEFENDINYLELPLIFEHENWVGGHPEVDGYLESNICINKEKFELILHNTIRKIINEKFDSKLPQILVNSEINTLYNNITDIEIVIPQEFYEFIDSSDKKLIIDKMNEIVSTLSTKEKGMLSNFDISIVTGLIRPKENWRQDIGREILKRNSITNQGMINNSEKEIIKYNFLRFRSPAEVNIAKELDKYNVLYFPLPVAVIKGKKKEPDFLIQHHKTKKFGILEINGDTYHTPTNSQEDHKRADIFHEKGIFVKFIQAKECIENPHKVLETFFKTLENF